MSVKLVPADRAVTCGSDVSKVVLQVTLSFVPKDESGTANIWEFAVTAEVSTTTVVAPAATTTEPAAAEPQTAGDALLEQLEAVVKVEAVVLPVTLNVPAMLTPVLDQCN